MQVNLPKTLISTFALLAATAATDAFARDQIHIVGSGTVFPFTSIAAEQFRQRRQIQNPYS